MTPVTRGSSRERRLDSLGNLHHVTGAQKLTAAARRPSPHQLRQPLAGDYTGNCADPRSGEVERDACVMQRENDMRTELGLKPRTRYSMRVR